MRAEFGVTGAARKEMVRIIGSVTGIKPVYMKAPTFAYAVGDITVGKDGSVEWDGRTGAGTIREVMDVLSAAGFTTDYEMTEAVEAEAEEPAEETARVTVTLPAEGHTGVTLRNLVNLVYTRAELINKALGTAFRVGGELKEALRDDACVTTAEAFLRTVTEHEDSLGGITFTPGKITFSTLPETEESGVIRAFTELCSMMNRQALSQKRIQAKELDEENDKYAMRIWLIRLGMNGAEYKGTRKILLGNLSGHAAFRTGADKQRWEHRQAEKRRAAGTGSMEETE